MAKQGEPYYYSPLGEDQIRVLELLPRRVDENHQLDPLDDEPPIQCRIQSVALHDPPKYEALSYTWGPTNIRHELQILSRDVNLGQLYALLNITKELHIALLRCRSDSDTVLLWVDQICINQNDLDERSLQVLFMKQIYQNSSRTIVWLGEPKGDVDILLLTEFIDAL
jgi:hypothetical protein